MKYPRTLSVLFAVIVALVVVGFSQAAQPPGKTLTLDGITINPLKSTLPSPTRLNSCIASALSYTAGRYPDVSGSVTVPYAHQLWHRADKDELKDMAPSAAARSPMFPVLMNVVYLHGKFQVASRVTVPYIFYILDPNCEVTFFTFGDESSFPALRAASQN